MFCQSWDRLVGSSSAGVPFGALGASNMGAVFAFSRQRYDLLNLHRDIDKLIALTTVLCSDEWSADMRRSVANARIIYDELLTRWADATMSPEEESVIDVKMGRVRSRLEFLGEKV